MTLRRPSVSIVIPTIAGREDELPRTLAAYERFTDAAIEWIIERDYPTCGAAWNAGAARATGDILHVTADDLEPESAAWLSAALAAIESGAVPMGWVREHERGQFGRDFCRVPTCRREWWRDVAADMHYFTDNFFTDVMTATGHPAVVAEGYDFYHRRSMVGRGAGMTEAERMEVDGRSYRHQLSGPR